MTSLSNKYKTSIPDLLENVTIIIPTLNEAENLKIVLKKLPPELDELIIIDANSEDDTPEVVKNYAPHARFIMQEGKGKGNAMIEAVNYATHDYIVFIDADGSMDPTEIYDIVYWLKKGYDIVKGSRFIPPGKSYDLTGLRKAGNKLLTLISCIVSVRQCITDLCYGYFGIKKSVFLDLNLRSKHFAIEAEIFTKAMIQGYKIKEIPSIEYPRINGTSNLTWWKDGMHIFIAILRSRLF